MFLLVFSDSCCCKQLILIFLTRNPVPQSSIARPDSFIDGTLLSSIIYRVDVGDDECRDSYEIEQRLKLVNMRTADFGDAYVLPHQCLATTCVPTFG